MRNPYMVLDGSLYRKDGFESDVCLHELGLH